MRTRRMREGLGCWGSRVVPKIKEIKKKGGKWKKGVKERVREREREREKKKHDDDEVIHELQRKKERKKS